jgi:DNA-binding response OmpR family regulator
VSAYVLVAEDDETQADILRQYLEFEGHRAVVVHDGPAALDLALRLEPDLLVLDVMLTALTTEEDQLAGLDLGADEYIIKPYSPRVLVARIRSLLRRSTMGPSPAGLRRIGPLVIDPHRHEVSVAGRPVECTRAEFAIIETMSEQPERVFTRNQLLTVTSGLDRSATPRAVDVHILNLRRKIEDDAHRPTRLVTVYGVGYKLTPGV